MFQVLHKKSAIFHTFSCLSKNLQLTNSIIQSKITFFSKLMNFLELIKILFRNCLPARHSINVVRKTS